MADPLSRLRVRFWLLVATVGAWIDREPFGPCFSWAMGRAAGAVRYEPLPEDGSGEGPW